MPAVDLLLHPVRLRIVQAFLGGRELTTGQLAGELPDVTQASLYRNIARLVEGDVLTVVAKRQARGAIERTYGLRLEAAQLGPDDLASLGREELSQSFAIFATVLMKSYDHYLASSDPTPDLVGDGVSYSMSALWLDDDEYVGFLREIAQLVAPYQANTPAEGRRRRLTASAFFPLIGDEDA